MKELISLPGIGEKTAKTLFNGGFNTLESIVNASPAALTVLQGIGLKTAEKIYKAAKEAIKK